MPLRIERESIWRRLAVRFKARTRGEEEAGYPILQDTLQPITDFDALAKAYKIADKTDDFTGGGTIVVFTVPKGQRWTLKAVRKGTFTIASNLSMYDGSKEILLLEAGTAADSLHGIEYQMEEDWVLRVTGGGAGDGARLVYIYYAEEEAF